MSYNNYLSPPGINKSKNTNIKDFCCHQNIFPRNLPKRMLKLKCYIYQKTTKASYLIFMLSTHSYFMKPVVFKE